MKNRVAAAVATLVALIAVPGRAATVQQLTLPAGYTIAREADHRAMVTDDAGTVYATVQPVKDPERTRALRWRPDGSIEFFTPTVQANDHFPISAPRIRAIAVSSGGAFVTEARTHNAGYLGVRLSVERWSASHAPTWTVPACAALGYAGAIVYAVDAERVALTVDPSADAPSPNGELPRALVLTGDRCTPLGTAILTGIRGPSIVGYIGIVNGALTARIVDLNRQIMEARAWLNGRLRYLEGFGVPFATTSTGIIVGASTLPGSFAKLYRAIANPHAVLWSRTGKRTELVHNDVRSVAWDINEAGAVVGTLQSATGWHYAFRWNHGRLELLDDLPHPLGWRFESAYAIAPDGTILGIGTYHGVATAFRWRP